MYPKKKKEEYIASRLAREALEDVNCPKQIAYEETAKMIYGKESCGIIPIMWKQSDLYLKKISTVILNIRASRINSRWNVNLHPQECLGGKKNATVAQNIYKNSAGIFQYHRTHVLCSFQALEYLQL